MSPLLHVELAAEPASAARSRRAITEWLSSLCGLATLCDTGQDLILAVNEAISNSAEHAYSGGPGVITLRAHARPMGTSAERQGCDHLEVLIEVRDRGRWRTPPDDPGFRGRGLMMARASVDRLCIDRTSSGTTVTLRRAAQRPAHAHVPA